MAEHPLNRHLFVADNINLLQRLDNESIDLICIDPPFAKNQTFIGNLRPPLSEEERQKERETLAGWDIYNERDATMAGIDWPDSGNTSRFRDIWRWESDAEAHHEAMQIFGRAYAERCPLVRQDGAVRQAHHERPKG